MNLTDIIFLLMVPVLMFGSHWYLRRREIRLHKEREQNHIWYQLNKK